MSLTINDFRNVLGKVNDGDVVFGRTAAGLEDKNAIEKANYGGTIAKLFRNYRTVVSDPARNREIRQAFMSAIENSREGRAAQAETLNAIRQQLGLEPADQIAARPLTRRDVQAILERLDADVKVHKLVVKEFASLANRGLYDANMLNEVTAILDEPQMRTIKAYKSLLPKNYLGLTSDAATKFVKNNINVIRANVAGELYMLLREGRLKNPAARLTRYDVELTVRQVVRDIMKAYAAGVPAQSSVTRLPKVPEQPQELDANLKARFDVQPGEEGGGTKAVPKLKAILPVIFGDAGEAPENGLSYAKLAAKGLSAMLMDDLSRLLVRLSDENHHNLNVVSDQANAVAGGLLGVDLAELAALDPADLKKLGRRILRELAGAGVDLAALPPGALLQRVGTKIQEALHPAATDKLIADRVANLFPNATNEVKENATKAIKERLAGATDIQKMSVAAYRKAVFKAALQGVAVPAEADSSVLDEIARDVEMSMNETAETRRNRFIEIGSDKACSMFFALFSVHKDETKELLGMLLALVVKFGPTRLYEAGILENDQSFGVKDVTGNAAKEELLVSRIRTLANELSTADARLVADYVKCGAAAADSGIRLGFANAWTDKPKGYMPVLEAFREGLIDFANLNPVACRRLLPIFVSVFAVQGGEETSGYVERIPLNESDEAVANGEDVETIRVIYPEVRTAQLKMGSDLSRFSIGEPEPDMRKRQLFNAPGARFSLSCGFGTVDVAAILKLLSECGIDPARLNEPETYRQFLVLQHLASANGFHLEGLKEWSERTVGKPFAEIHLIDIAKLLVKQGDADAVIKDKMDDYGIFSGNKPKVANFVRGRVTLQEAKLSKEEMVQLRQALLSLTGADATVTTKVMGYDVTLSRSVNGTLTGVFDGMPFAYPRPLNELVAEIENAIVAQAGEYSVDDVKAILPQIENGVPVGMPIGRARELAVGVLAAKLGELPVTFSAFSTVDLVTKAVAALDGRFTKANLPAEPSKAYNSSEVIELHAKLVSADPLTLDKVKLPSQPEPLSIAVRQAQPPAQKTVHDFVADLILNKDTWSFDTAAAEPGARLKSVLKDYGPELVRITKDPTLLNTLPEQIRDDVKAIFADLAAVAENIDGMTANQLTALETKVGALIESAMTKLQEVVRELFTAQAQANVGNGELWQRTFSEISGTGGIDPNTENGRFMVSVLNSYFTGADPIEKRAMLSAFIRNTNNESSKGRLVAELLKGAGPLLQKMLQGLPLDSFGPETKIALKDMKSKLAPIPDEVVRAELLELLRTSKGEILSIEVKKTIGAATVGQALLCHIRTKTHPVAGEDVVIKLLRPNVENAIQREFVRLNEIAGQQSPAMAKSFRAQYESILKELDFTLEAANIDIGRTAYDMPADVEGEAVTQVRSMARSTAVPPRRGVMVLEKVEGDTFDGYAERSSRELDVSLTKQGVRVDVAEDPNAPVKKTISITQPGQFLSVKQEVDGRIRQGGARREKLEKVISAWVDQALFGTGFMHCDMHAGNIMCNDEAATVIDFGNAMRLSAADRDRLCVLVLSSLISNADLFAERIKDFLPDEAKAVFEGKKDLVLADLGHVLAKGTGKDVARRLLSGIAILQKHGIQVPASVNGFAASLTRLEAALGDFDEYLHDLEDQARGIQFAPECSHALSNPDELVKKALPVFGLIDQALLLLSDGQTRTLDELSEAQGDLLQQAVGERNGMVKQEAIVELMEKGGMKEAFAEPDRGVGLLDAFMAKYGTLRLYSSYVGYYVEEKSTQLETSIAEYKSHVAAEPAQDAPEHAEWTTRLAKLQRILAEKMLRHAATLVSSTLTHMAGLGEVRPQRTFDSLVSSTIESRLRSLGPLGLAKFVKLGVTKAMGEAIFDAQDDIDAYENRLAAAVARADKEADALGQDETVPSSVRRKLVKQAEDFCLPTEGLPEAATLQTPEGRGRFLDILRTNLSRVRLSLGKEALAPAEAKYLACVLQGVLGKSLTTLMGALDEQARASLRQEIGEEADLMALFDGFGQK
ncbi:MAG: AarF/UbiB family protein [Kiritimatiellae bacterium]|nr:AarF/UbiB family protein [Kiritimatiellia bacterium]